jgi:RNA-splicing ligase RtcB
MITGLTLQEWGFKPGKWFKEALVELNRCKAEGMDERQWFELASGFMPVEISLRTNALAFSVFLDPESDLERANLQAVHQHMDALMRVPTIKAGAVMPDACPAGKEIGTIPVGGAVACEDAIHPGFHSADICCSVAMSVLRRRDDPKKILDAVQAVTHFGPGGRSGAIHPPRDVMAAITSNRYLSGLENLAVGHFASQGDGNHFAYVGHLKSTGQPVLVTHHGSRGLGAQLYKRGMADAKRHAAIHAPKVSPHNAWLKASSTDGEAYWTALQTIREWTKASHFAIHDLASRKIGNSVDDRFWNEHNFVFQKSDGLFYHGKGATPSWKGFSADDDGRTLIPLNMSEPILIVGHKDRKDALGFAPHGAGRNASRTAHMRDNANSLTDELASLASRGLDIRAFCGIPDLSELPSAYKNAGQVTAAIERHNLARIVDTIQPRGSMMAGEMNWNRRR